LRGYAKQIDSELRDVELASVREYVAQSDNLVELNHQIRACDATLARMQEMLLGFQADLGGISDEIKHLQDESILMNIKLRNRRAAEEKLGKFLEHIVVAPELAKVICSSEVNEAYLEFVAQLDDKIKYLSRGEGEGGDETFGTPPSQTEAGRTIAPQLNKLKAKAITKIREYFLSKIGKLRQPKTNVGVIQQTYLQRYARLMTFLEDYSPPVAEEVRQVYVEIMGRNIHNLFKAYHTQLGKLEESIATQADTIVLEENAVRSFFSSRVDLSKRNDAFSLQERDKILDQVEERPVLVHVAQAEGTKLPYEAIHRSVMKHLMDCASAEYLFTLEFFQGHSQEVFDQLFSRVWQLVMENLENYLFGCHDAIGLLILIQLTHSHRRIMQRRMVPALDNLLDRIIMMLWPRFKFLFDSNLRSVKQANPRKLGVVELHPHYITRRYAEFAASILALHIGMNDESTRVTGSNTSGGGEEMVLKDLATLREAVNELLERLAAQLPSNKQRVVFMVNNCDTVLTVLAERQVGSGADGGLGEAQRWEELLSQHRAEFVEEELLERYSRLIAFVQQTEGAMAAHAEGGPAPQVDEQTVGMLVRDFSSSWKSGIESINQDVLAYFSNFKNGMEVLKQVLTQLLLYYSRFQEIIRKTWRKLPPFTKDLVSTSQILVEIKKYSRTF